jgi:chromosome segregation ATPase
MATTWGVKMEEEEKERLQSLIEQSGLNSKDFMNELVAAYEVNRTKEAVPVIASDIDELQKLTSRINAIFVGIGDRINTLTIDKDRQYQDQLSGKLSLIDTLQEKIKALQLNMQETDEQNEGLVKSNDELSKEMVNLKTELNRVVNQYNQVNQSNQALIEQYKEKIDTLTGLVNEYKQAKEENSNLTKALQDAELRIGKIESETKERTGEVLRLQDKMTDVEETHKMQLQQVKEHADFEKDKALLEVEKKYQVIMQEMQEKYNTKVQELLSRMEENKAPTKQPEAVEKVTITAGKK